jgi:GNAT superfamily N-acetyltransferase
MTEIRSLTPDDVDAVIAAGLGLARLPLRPGAVYLVAWEEGTAVGHAHLSEADPPEVGDVEVLPSHRGRGLGTALMRAAEQAAAERGHDRLRLTVSASADGPQSLYHRLGYVDTGMPPRRVQGTIQIRSGPLEVDDTLLTWEKDLRAVDSERPRSS